MIMICNVPDEVVKSVKMGTWCGSSVAEKMISNGIPLDKLRERVELEKLGYPPSAGYYQAIMKVLRIIDKYKADSEDKDA